MSERLTAEELSQLIGFVMVPMFAAFACAGLLARHEFQPDPDECVPNELLAKKSFDVAAAMAAEFAKRAKL